MKFIFVLEDYFLLDYEVFYIFFSCFYFIVLMVFDVVGVLFGGVFKNIVVIVCGFVEGYGWNMIVKIVVMCCGMLEIIQFVCEFYFEIIQLVMFWEESVGWGDMIVSCIVVCNWWYFKMVVECGVFIQEIECIEFNGQKLQGILILCEVSSFLRVCGIEDKYFLFRFVDGILDGKVNVNDIFSFFRKNQVLKVIFFLFRIQV